MTRFSSTTEMSRCVSHRLRLSNQSVLSLYTHTNTHRQFQAICASEQWEGCLFKAWWSGC